MTGSMFDGMSENVTIEKPVQMQRNFMDFRMLYPYVVVRGPGCEGELSHWDKLLTMHGWDAMRDMYIAVAPTSERKLWYDKACEHFYKQVLARKAAIDSHGDAIEAMIRTRSPAAKHLVQLALEAGVVNNIPAIANWAALDLSIVNRLKKANLI